MNDVADRLKGQILLGRLVILLFEPWVLELTGALVSIKGIPPSFHVAHFGPSQLIISLRNEACTFDPTTTA